MQHALRRLLCACHTVSAVVVGKNDISVLIEVVCKIVVSASVFRHTVRDLDYALGRAHVVPKITLQYGSVKTLKFFGFHKFSSYRESDYRYSIWIYCNTRFLAFQDVKIRNFV